MSSKRLSVLKLHDVTPRKTRITIIATTKTSKLHISLLYVPFISYRYMCKLSRSVMRWERRAVCMGNTNKYTLHQITELNEHYFGLPGCRWVATIDLHSVGPWLD
jgi:hypothetical protein